MIERIKKKKIFKIEFVLASALSIGSGDNYRTDKDIIYGSDGIPYIPASAIAGVCINILDNVKSDGVSEKAESRVYKKYWGYISKAVATNKTVAESMESKIVFYDANIVNSENDKIKTSTRDSVALGEYKTAIPGAKFDMEILEPGIRFVTYVEQNYCGDNDPNLAQSIAYCFESGLVSFGAKTSRGYGAIKNVKVSEYEVVFDTSNDEGKKKISKYCLSKSMDELPWIECEELKKVELESRVQNERTIRIALKQRGGISIRRYTTAAPVGDEIISDYTQLTTSDGTNVDKPVIPGTTWAGVFEHQIKKHLGKAYDKSTWNEVFGYVEGKKKQKSKISFGESIIKSSKAVQFSRNAIDRFTGGAASKALFTETTYYGGDTELSISLPKDLSMPDSVAKALAATIVDLHYGFMAVGGETAIGRGLFYIEKIADSMIKVPDVNDINGAQSFYADIYSLISKREVEQ